jgi:hypothetical protein
MWKLKEHARGNSKEENARMVKEKFETLKGIIPGMTIIEVGIDFSKTENSADIVLYTEFNTKADLQNYQNHPEHKTISSLVSDIRDERTIVDYEV